MIKNAQQLFCTTPLDGCFWLTCKASEWVLSEIVPHYFNIMQPHRILNEGQFFGKFRSNPDNYFSPTFRVNV